MMKGHNSGTIKVEWIKLKLNMYYLYIFFICYLLIITLLPFFIEMLQYHHFSYSYVEVYSCNKFEFISYLLAFQ